MTKTFILLSAIISMTQVGWAQFGEDRQLAGAEISSITINPEDVAQDSIQRSLMTTNKFVVRWHYTEEGAKKMRVFWDAHAGQKICTRIGNYESAASLLWTNTAASTVKVIPWEKTRTDKVLGISESDADAIVAGLKKK